MKKETLPKDDQREDDGGFPSQIIFLLSVLGLAILAIVLKVMNAI